MKRFLSKWKIALFIGLLYAGCKSGSNETVEEAATPRTPVSVTAVSYASINDSIELNATSVFLQQNFVKANLNGYIQQSNIKYGDYVHPGKVLFVLKTKEARAIGNAVNQLDSSFKFSGVNVIRANTSGYVAEINHQAGDYVQDGEQLVVISDSKSFTFVMNVPYEDKPFVSIGKNVSVVFPDKKIMNGIISSSMPTMDSVTQTQAYSVKVNAAQPIPKDLIVRIRILKSSINNAQMLPKSSVLADETQSTFWVMKLINDSTAVKVPVQKGIEKENDVQILSPQFSTNDKILSGGNYGLSDTALVTASPGPSKGGE